jgi:hypothetical protein
MGSKSSLLTDAVEKVGFSVGVMPLGSSDPAEMSRLLGVEAV